MEQKHIDEFTKELIASIPVFIRTSREEPDVVYLNSTDLRKEIQNLLRKHNLAF